MPASDGSNNVVGVCFPDERLWFSIVLLDEAIDGRLQVNDGVEDAMLQPSARQFREEAFDCVEPRAGCRNEVEGPSWMPCQPGAHLRLLMGRVIVENDVDGFVFWQFRLDGVEEANEFLMPVALHVLADHRSVENVEGGKQGGGAMALVIMGHRARASLLERQARLGPVKRLDLAFLINRQNNGVGRRGDIEADDIVKLLGKSLVILLL